MQYEQAIDYRISGQQHCDVSPLGFCLLCLLPRSFYCQSLMDYRQIVMRPLPSNRGLLRPVFFVQTSTKCSSPAVITKNPDKIPCN